MDHGRCGTGGGINIAAQMMRINISQLLDWKTCPRVWHNRHRSRRGRPASEALADGTYWHERAQAELECFPEGAYAGAMPQPINNVQAAMDLWIAEHLRERTAEWEIVELEQSFSEPLGEHYLVGTPDGVVVNRASQEWYLLQWKTVSGSRPLDVLFDEVRIGWHECAYQWAMQRYYKRAFAGTLLGVWRKLGVRQAKSEEPFVMVPLTRSNAEVDAAMREVTAIVSEIAAAERYEIRDVNVLPGNRRQCVQWNWRCQYFGVCHGGMTLADSEFIDIEDRYASVEVAE